MGRKMTENSGVQPGGPGVNVIIKRKREGIWSEIDNSKQTLEPA
jgi:hypothetical protein